MKRTVFIAVVMSFSAYNVFSQAGSQDTEFGAAGFATVVFKSLSSGINSLALQSNGKIVAGGFVESMSDYNFLITRFNPDGSTDNSFGNHGHIITSVIPDSYETIEAVNILQGGKIIAFGNASSHSESDIVMFCFKNDGMPDSSFGTNGIVTDLGFEYDKICSFFCQPDGKIWVCGKAGESGHTDFMLARFNSDGSPDDDFGSDGIITTDFGYSQQTAYKLLVQPDGKIILIGSVLQSSTDQNFAIARYNSDGSLDDSFGNEGKVVTSLCAGDDNAFDGILQEDGKIVAAGHLHNGIDFDFAIIRYNPDGVIDQTFGINGIVTTSIGTGNDFGRSLQIQSDGKLILAGISWFDSQCEFTMARYNDNGIPDESFGMNGIITTNNPLTDDYAYAALIQPDNKIILGGYSCGGSKCNIKLTRYLLGEYVGIIDFSRNENDMMIYPNPINQNTILKYTLHNEEEITIQLIDLQGRILTTYITNEIQPAGDYSIPVIIPEELKQGIYLIGISSKKGRMFIEINN